MQYHIEPLNGGVVMNRHPLLMNPGELQASYELYYPPWADSLDISPRASGALGALGWSISTSHPSAANIAGICNIVLDTPPGANASGYNFGVVLWTNWPADTIEDGIPRTAAAEIYGYFLSDSISSGFSTPLSRGEGVCTAFLHTMLTDPVEVTASFMASGESCLGINSVSLGDKAIIMNGASPNVVLLPSLELRNHGIKAVQEVPTVTTATSNVSSNGLLTSGIWDYWVTPVRKYEDAGTSYSEEIEGAYAPTDPATAQITGTGDAWSAVLATVTKPSLPWDATHWRIYRGLVNRSTATDAVFPQGYRVGEMPISATSFTDGSPNTTNTAISIPTIGRGRTTFGAVTQTYTIENTFDSSDESFHGVANNYSNGSTYRWIWKGFSTGLGGIESLKFKLTASGERPSVRGVNHHTLKLKAGYSLGTGTADNDIGWSPPITEELDLTFEAAQTAGEATIPCKGLFDYAYFSNRNFQVEAMLKFPDGIHTTADPNYFNIHEVKLLVTALGPGVSVPIETYDYVTIQEVGEDTVEASVHMPPPIATIGCVYEDSVVLVPATARNSIQWSAPGHPESFPTPYYLEFTNNKNDKISWVGVINGKLVAIMKNSVWRINYLPSIADANFNRAQAAELIAENLGADNFKLVTIYSLPNGRQEVAFATPLGIYSTDGFAVRLISSDIGYTPNTLHSLTNDFDSQSLVLLLTDGNVYYGSYAARHMKPEGLKWSGPTNWVYGDKVTQITPLRLSDQTSILAAAMTGMSAIQLTDFTIPGMESTATTTGARVITRTISLAELGGEFQLEELHVNGMAGISNQSYNVSVTAHNSMRLARTYSYTIPTSNNSYATMTHMTGMGDAVGLSVYPVSAVARNWMPSFFQIGYSVQGTKDAK